MKKLTIEELLEPLGFSDPRSVRTWCSNNDVLVVNQGKNEFVFEADFKLAYELPLINKLKKKFGHDWEQVYQLYSEGNIPALNILNEAISVPVQLYKKKPMKDCPFTKKIKEYEKNRNDAA